MRDFKYFMPVELYFGKNSVEKNSGIFKKIGKKALIVTGHSSAKKNGSQNDVVSALEKNNIKYCIFDKTEENPSLETVTEAARFAVEECVDFVIGIGGGSPMDSAKAIAFLAANPDENPEFLFEPGEAKHLPVVEIPTTAGTGSEVTQYSILTVKSRKIKMGVSKRTFANAAFLDPKYFMDIPVGVTRNTAVDAFTHLIEAYLCNENSALSDILCEKGLKEFKKCKEALIEGQFNMDIRERLLIISTIAGMAISQSQTSLPHAMGYYLTYFKNLGHGHANAQFTKAFMDFVPEKDRVKDVLDFAGFESTGEIDEFFRKIVTRVQCSDEDINYYTDEMMKIKGKLSTVNRLISREDMYNMFKEGVM